MSCEPIIIYLVVVCSFELIDGLDDDWLGHPVSVTAFCNVGLGVITEGGGALQQTAGATRLHSPPAIAVTQPGPTIMSDNPTPWSVGWVAGRFGCKKVGQLSGCGANLAVVHSCRVWHRANQHSCYMKWAAVDRTTI